MTFQGIDNQTVELRVTNYQFPDISFDQYDSNWLNVYLKVESKLGNWQTIDPALLTWEVEEIIDWLHLRRYLSLWCEIMAWNRWQILRANM
jgi:hypothetical protein